MTDRRPYAKTLADGSVIATCCLSNGNTLSLVFRRDCTEAEALERVVEAADKKEKGIE